MPTSDWDTLEPTDGTPGNAYELGLDVEIGAAWVNVPDITALNPSPTPQTRNRSTYAAKGQPKPTTFARGMTLGFNVEQVRDEAGQYQEELQYLLDKAALLGDDNKIRARFFDTIGADYAYEAEWSVEHSRPNTGDTDAGFFGFTLTATSTPEKIPNPVADGADPQIISVLPAGQGVGDIVVIHGRYFTGATAVSIDGVAAFSGATVVDDRTIAVEIPVGAAGASAVTVTTPAGTSPALSYTVV